MNKFYLFLISILALNQVNAQDECTSAATATVGTSCAYTTFNLSGYTASTSPAAPGCFGTINYDAWLVFTATGSTTTVTYNNTNRDAAVAVYSGACASLTLLGCANANGASAGTETVVVPTTPGNNYYVRIARVNNGGGSMGGQYCIWSSNDNCPDAIALTPALSCVYTAGDVAGMTASGTTPLPSCATTSPDEDVWYSFTATATTHTVTVQGSTSFDPVIQVLSGTCGSLTQINCTNASGLGGTETANLTGLTIGTTYYIRVCSFGTGMPATTTFNICVVGGTPVGGCPGGLGTLNTDYFVIAGGLTTNYTHNSQTTCGKGNQITSSNVAAVCGSSAYYGGEDVVYQFTPTNSGQSTITLTSSGSWTGIMLYAGCPLNAGTTCVGTAQSSTGNKSMCVNLVAGTTYYLIIDSWPSPTCNPYSLSITAPSGIASGATCGTAVPVGSLPYTATSQSTACFGNDYTNASTGSCGTLYESGEDKVYSITVSGPTCIGINITNASTTSIGFQVYSGCPGVAGTTCVGNAGGATAGVLSSSVVLPAAGTYYVIVDTWSSPFNATYDLNITNLGSSPSNDLPCNATALTLGTYEPGDNSCTGAVSEPANPSCWGSGTRNTVWFSFNTGALTTVKLATTLGTLQNTQIAVYSGTCGSLTQIACNDNAPSCGSSSNPASQLTLTGLTINTTYYVVVDGVGNATGTFSILAFDGSLPFPAIPGMDCDAPNPVCAQQFSVADPGYSGYGNICDLPSSYCLASAERNVVWYTVPINANGNLIFDIVPNDFDPVLESETDYDFAVWRIQGSGAVTCTQIASGAATPLECNYSGLGVTGLNNNVDGDAPGNLTCSWCGAYNPDPQYDFAYQSQIPVSNGDVMLIAISNFSNSTSGFYIDFRTSPIGYTASTATSVTWSGGGGNTVWTQSANWGGCNTPACNRSAVIVPFSLQPVITANATVNDLTINPGASLTIAAGVTVNICGNFINNGSLIMQAGSTIEFTNGANHNITGNFTGANRIWNLTINQPSGTVNLNANLDLAGNFTTSSATSVFNTNGNYIKIAGNFVNAAGNTTFTNVGTTGTLEFNGTAAQTYNEGSSALDLQNVIMNHTGPGVTLLSNMRVKAATGLMTLTLGRVITNAFTVIINNTAAGAITNGNASSFVQGNLRRFTNGAATTYEFPVGHATPGYQRATVAYTAANSNTSLLARFDTWATVPNGCVSNECPANNYNLLQAYNNGYWTITAQSNPTTGTYNMTLWPTNYTNNVGAGWSIMKAPNIAGTWALDGVCAASTASQVIRTGMTGFSVFSVVQSATPLPVEFLFFNGESTPDRNKLFWATASETNNDYFVVERSADGVNFYEIGRVDGAGNSTQRRDYTFDDLNPISGIGYYRIKQVDFNGQSSHSDMITLTFQRGNMSVQAIRPNPTAGDVSIDFAATKDTEIHIVIMDVTGRLVVDEMRKVQEGMNIITMGITDGAGVYTIKITDNVYGFQHIERIVKY